MEPSNKIEQLKLLDEQIAIFQKETGRLPIIWTGATANFWIKEVGIAKIDHTLEYHNCEVRFDKTLKNEEFFLE